MNNPLAPFSIPAWSAALQAVDQSPSLLVERYKTSRHCGHYAFPDPGLLISPTTDIKKARHIGSWFRVRDAWIIRLQNEPSLAMSSQHWQTFLAMDLNILEKGGTKAAMRRREVLDVFMPTSDGCAELRTCFSKEQLI